MDVSLDDGSWERGTAERAAGRVAGRECLRFDGESSVETVADLEIVDGAIEVDIAVGGERAFHGVAWRVQDAENYESFFVRPHQVGNDDAIQYTPVVNDSSGWQLYHGPGSWAPVSIPLDEWFTIRVVFAADVAEIYVASLDQPALITRLRRHPVAGQVGILVGGPGLHVSRFAVDTEARPSSSAPADLVVSGTVPAWQVSDPFEEGELPDSATRTWTRLESEPSGLVNLARAHAIRGGRNTVYARATVRSRRAQTKELAVGFSDRVLVLLNGRPLYRGDATYRSRDYRFLGSIGYWDALSLPLREGDNELVAVVSEDFGGWGIQARFHDTEGIVFVD